MSDKCDSDVYENGTRVFLTHTISAKDVEKWVKAVAEKSGQKVDWHYVGGRAVILALGDLEKVYDALSALRRMHDEMYRKASAKFLGGDARETDIIIDGIWKYNGIE